MMPSASPATLQRQVSPIPPGRYWMFVLGQLSIDEFGTWVRDMAGAVKVRTAEEDREASPPALFVIFEVPEGRAPFLNAAQFGLPSVAPPSVQSAQDVTSVPRGLGPFGFDPDSMRFFSPDESTRGEGSFFPAGVLPSLGDVSMLAIVVLAIVIASQTSKVSRRRAVAA